jgi:hypothetical protein
MNVHSISPDLHAARAKQFDRIDRVLSVIDEETGNTPFVALLQETWLDPNLIGKYAEAGMPLLSSVSGSSNYPCLVSDKVDPLKQVRGRGLMIIVHPEVIKWVSDRQGKQVILQKIDHITVRSFEILAGALGPIFMVSVYIKQNGSMRPDYEHLIDTIRRLKPAHCTRTVVGGDFNYRENWYELSALFEGQLDLVSAVEEGGITSTHNRGNVLDHVLLPSGMVVDRVEAIGWEFSDHALVKVVVDLDVVRQSSRNNGETRSESLNIGRFRRIRAEVSRKNPLPRVESVETHKSFMREVGRMIAELESQLDGGDGSEEEEDGIGLETLNTRLLDVAVESFGGSRPRHRIQKAFMYDKKVRKAAAKREKCRKAFNKASGGGRVAAKEELKKANKQWEKERRSAQRKQEDDLARAIECGDVSVFWALFKKTRTARPADSCNAKLSPDDAFDFYRSLFSDPETAKFIQESIPDGDHSAPVQVSEEEVIEALTQTRDCASGPDGVHPILLRHCKKQLAPLLARLYTKCLTYGLPKGLRVGTITLIAKCHPPSSNPALYRPITLLPAIVRVLMRVIDNKIRKLIDRGVIRIPLEQGGFIKNRSTALQTFILLLLRDWANSRKESLYIVYLDIEKAFDSFNHKELLEILRKVGVPPEIVDAIHRLLPYFELRLFDRLFDQEKGTFQGSPLSPLLSVLFLIDFIEFINDNKEGFVGVSIPVDIIQTIRAVLFADDIVLVASSIDQLRIALRLAGLWAERRKVRFNLPKCEAMRLARKPSDRTTREELAVVELQGHSLNWVHEYKHLGHRIVEAPEYRRKAEQIIPIDDKKLTGLCFAMARAFPSTARVCRVAPLAVRLGVKQVIHAKYLYPTALIDTDYDLLDKRIRRSVRYLLGMPTDSSSAQLHADLGIWPSEYYAHQRALRMAWRLASRYWTRGDRTLVRLWDGSIVEGSASERPKFLNAWSIKSSGGILHRLAQVLKVYGLTWEAVYQYQGGQSSWYEEVSKRLSERFGAYCNAAAEQYDHPILAFDGPSPKDTPRIKRALRMGGELAVAALRMRCPSLRLRPDHGHGRCRYCKKGRENGRHLLQCQAIPQDLLAARLGILDSIKVESWSKGISSLAAADLALSFNWRSMDDSTLKRLLVWCRNMINRYADFVPEWEVALEAYPVYRVRPRCR